LKTSRYILALSILLSAEAVSQRTIPMTLKTMVQQAGTIVHARVAELRTGKDPVTGFPATWVTLDVKEDFFGAPATRFTFKQIGGEADGMVYKPADVPGYSRNEEVVLMLYPPHSRTAFQSPVGLGQGKFKVKQAGASRKKVAEQVTRSHRLLKTSGATAYDGIVALEDLKEEIRTLVRTEKGVSK